MKLLYYGKLTYLFLLFWYFDSMFECKFMDDLIILCNHLLGQNYTTLIGLNYKSNTHRREIVYVVKIYFAYVLQIDNKMIACILANKFKCPCDFGKCDKSHVSHIMSTTGYFCMKQSTRQPH